MGVVLELPCGLKLGGMPVESTKYSHERQASDLRKQAPPGRYKYLTWKFCALRSLALASINPTGWHGHLTLDKRHPTAPATPDACSS